MRSAAETRQSCTAVFNFIADIAATLRATSAVALQERRAVEREW
jgi:hypothetical protein